MKCENEINKWSRDATPDTCLRFLSGPELDSRAALAVILIKSSFGSPTAFTFVQNLLLLISRSDPLTR